MDKEITVFYNSKDYTEEEIRSIIHSHSAQVYGRYLSNIDSKILIVDNVEDAKRMEIFLQSILSSSKEAKESLCILKLSLSM